jgi:hypothetical protein
MSKALPKNGSACARVQVSNTRLRVSLNVKAGRWKVDDSSKFQSEHQLFDLGHIFLPAREEFSQWEAGIMTGQAVLELANLLFGWHTKSTLADVCDCSPRFIERYQVSGTMSPPALAIAVLRICCHIRLIDHIASLDVNDQWPECAHYGKKLTRAFGKPIPFPLNSLSRHHYGIWGTRLMDAVIERARRERYEFDPFETIFGLLERPRGTGFLPNL